jgi:hypothetical protein
MKEGILLHSAIDTDERGLSDTRRWISEYKQYLVLSTYSPVIGPLSADITLANLPENQIY